MKINKNQLRMALQAILSEDCNCIDDVLFEATSIIADLLTERKGFRETLEKEIMLQCLEERLEIE